jgi:hypothetical protein
VRHPPQARLLISSVKTLISAVHSSKAAAMVENNIIKIVIKYHFLMSSNAIDDNAWLAMDAGLREAFKW